MKKMDIILTNGIFSYDLEIIEENSASYYAVNMYGTIYRISKKNKKVYKGKMLVGVIEKMNIF
jgi:hypothetical protein